MRQVYLRYQDREGRGPFRPGMTARWADVSGEGQPAVFDRFPDFTQRVQEKHIRGLHVGCACVGWEGLYQYFTEAERERLHALGYRLHRVAASDVFLSDDIEAVFASRRRLKDLPRARAAQ